MSRLGFVASVLASTCGLLLACGGRSELDDYSDGVPSIVPMSNAVGDGDTGNNGDGDRGDGDQGDGDQGDGDQGDGDATSTGADVGEACGKSSDCMGGSNANCITSLQIDLGFIQLPITFPGGSCTITGCKTDADCPKGAGCLMGFAAPACTKLCNDATECRADEGYTCNSLMFGSSDTRKFCQPPVNLPF